MYNYPYLEQFYKDNFSKLLDWRSPLRPSKSCPKNGAAGVAKFLDFYKKTGLRSFTEDEVLTIINAKEVEDGDTIFHQNIRVMRELKFVSAADNGEKRFDFTEQFISFANSNHSVECYIIEKLMSLSSVDDLTMYFNFLICVMREAAIHGQVILYRDAADKFALDVSDEQKRKEHQERIYKIYGFKGDEARSVPEHYTPNISYFCHAVLKQLGILKKSDVRIDNMGTLELTPLGELILKRIDENLQHVQQKSTEWKGAEEKSTKNQKLLQQIFYGAPGTGKSHKVKELTGKDNVVRTTFHPDSDYSTFVGAYKPTTVDEPLMTVIGTKAVPVENSDGTQRTESKIVYEFVEQAFLKAYIKAWKLYAEDENNPKKQYLVIEEINRGNCAQIFGDLFQLLDRGANGFSEYPIDADKDMQKHLAKAFKDMAYLEAPAIGEMSAEETARAIRNGEKLILPSNLYIWATMNTSDQSLFPIDSAFKRRWDWEYVPIHDGGKGWQIEADGKRYDWWQFVDAMNNKIGAATYSEDKKLGYFFCKAKDGVIDAETFVGKVIFYVWNDVFKDFAEEAGNLFKDVDGSMLSFNKFYAIGTDGKRTVMESKITVLMQNLGVDAITSSISSSEEVVGDIEEELQNDIFGNQRKETLISISIPNNPTIKSSDSTQFDAFIKALRVIGFERIKSVASSLKYKRLGNIPVISTQRNEIIDNNNQGFSYYEEAGLFIIKGCKYYTYIRILEDLNSMLNIGLTMETK